MKKTFISLLSFALFAGAVRSVSALDWDQGDLLGQLRLQLAQMQAPASVSSQLVSTSQPVPKSRSVYPGKCVFALSYDWGVTSPDQVRACQGVLNEYAVRCVAAVVRDWGVTSVDQIKACAQVETPGAAICVEGLQRNLGVTGIFEIKECAKF